MKFKINNNKIHDSVVISGDNIKECQEETTKQLIKRGWKREDCYSEIL